MKTFNTRIATLALAMATTLGASISHAESTPPSVVIVHGAFADGSDWAKVVPLLQAKGIAVTVVQNPSPPWPMTSPPLSAHCATSRARWCWSATRGAVP